MSIALFAHIARREVFMAIERILFAVTAVIVGSGCTGTAPPGDPGGSGCPTARPATIEECAAGLSYADCGGMGPAPVFACKDRECLWFEGACAPEDWHASECPSTDVCCLEGAPLPSGLADPLAVPMTTNEWGIDP